jgi:hypothetical protein
MKQWLVFSFGCLFCTLPFAAKGTLPDCYEFNNCTQGCKLWNTFCIDDIENPGTGKGVYKYSTTVARIICSPGPDGVQPETPMYVTREKYEDGTLDCGFDYINSTCAVKGMRLLGPTTVQHDTKCTGFP